MEGATFVDALPWFEDGGIGVSPDGAAELDEAGHQALADRLVDELRGIRSTP